MPPAADKPLPTLPTQSLGLASSLALLQTRLPLANIQA